MKWVRRLIHQIAKSKYTTSNYLSLMESCNNLEEGRQFHAHMLITGVYQNDFVGSKLLSAYAKCGSILDACLVFEKTPRRNAMPWNAMIRAYVDHGHFVKCVDVYKQMQVSGMVPDNMTFPCVLKACAALRDLQLGNEIHQKIVAFKLESSVFVGTALVDMYVKCGNVEVARQVFDKMPQRNLVSWTAMIGGYIQNGYGEEALALFHRMRVEGVYPCVVTVATTLPACTELEALEQGKEIHGFVIKSGYERHNFVLCSLINMYAKCGSVEDACTLFDNISQRNEVLWTAIIAGCSQTGNGEKALRLFKEMQGACVKPSPYTISSILPAIGRLECLQDGQVIHNYVIKTGLDSNAYIGCALVDMYVKCKHMAFAHHVFEEMPVRDRDAVSWSSLIFGYAQNGYDNISLKLFREMQFSGVKPNSISMASILSACAHLAAQRQGREIHGFLIRNHIIIDDIIESSLMNMYAKCGSIELARHVFDKMLRRDIVSWNAMILGYGMHGRAEDAHKLFHEMQLVGVNPDDVTFMAILSTCSHGGLVDKGCEYFESMTRYYQVTPRVEHYACIIDLLGRSGRLDEAYNVVKKMPLEPSKGVWGALLAACRTHCNVELGEYAAENILKLGSPKASYFVLMSHIYAEAGRWDGVAKMRTILRDRGLKRNPGCSWIEVKNKVHLFVQGDKVHLQ